MSSTRNVGIGDVLWGIRGNILVNVSKSVDDQNEVPGAPIWLIHGAFDSLPRVGNHWRGADDVRAHIKKLFGYEYYMPRWGGLPSQSSIHRGARTIAQQIIRWRRLNQGTPLILIGYSHGGNVNKGIVNILDRNDPPIFVNTMINIGTPIMKGLFTISAKVGQHINVFNPYDAIQRLGSVHSAPIEGAEIETGIPMRGLVIPEDPRWYDGAVNVPVQLLDSSGPLERHDFMHSSVSVWKNYIQRYLELPPPN